MPSIEQLRVDLAMLVGRDSQAIDAKYEDDDMFSVIERYCGEQGTVNQWTKGTFKRMGTLRNHLNGYAPIIQMSSVTESWVQGFVDYLVSKGLNNTYIAKQVAILRGVLRWAANRGLYGGNVHEVYKPKLRGSHFEIKEVIYLTLDELRTIENYQFTDRQATLEMVRDVFVFCCYTFTASCSCTWASEMNTAESMVNTIACMKHTSTSRSIMKMLMPTLTGTISVPAMALMPNMMKMRHDSDMAMA